MSKRPSPVVIAAGALVWREREGELEVLLIHRPRYDDWSWPKGKLDPGETIPVAAVREVAEETGLEVALGVPLPMLRYRVSGGRQKEVHYWAARELASRSPARDARPPVRPCVDEVDEQRWVTPREAQRMLSKRSDRKPLKALVTLHERGELDTYAVAVVRHARARGRSGWAGPEADRPLTTKGESQARALTSLLAAFGTEKVVTSPWARCAATVAPFVSAAKISPTEAPQLTEHAHHAAPEAAKEVFVALLGAGSSSALCTHRPVLATIFRAIDARASEWVRRSRPRKDPFLRPASVAVLHVRAGGHVVSFEVQSPDSPARAKRRR